MSSVADFIQRRWLVLGGFALIAGVVLWSSQEQPVPRETFIAYGHAFQQRFVPEVERRHVTSVRRSGREFAVQLDDGEIIAADKVILRPEVYWGTPAPSQLALYGSEDSADPRPSGFYP